jgi:peptidyl-prolyl cis-trans isomerase D
MLPYLRKYSRSKLLYGFLAAVFVAWGVGTVGMQRMDVIARVHGEPITRRQLEQTVARVQQRYESLAQGGLTPELAKSLDIPGRALDELIDGALLEHEAERLGIAPSEEEVLLAITQIPELQQGGVFDRARLQAYLESQRDRGEFERDMRRQLVVRRVEALATDGVHVTDAELEEQYRLEHEKVSLAFVRVPAAEHEAGVAASEEDLAKFHEEHAERYRLPTRVRARYVAYRARDLAPQVELTDDDVTSWYESTTDPRFVLSERVRARHILVKAAADAPEATREAARKEADEILAEIRGGADFATVAKKRSDDGATAPSGGDLGVVERGKLAPALETAVWALTPGEVTEVVESPEGFSILKLEEHLPAGLRPLAEVRAEVEEAIRAERAFERARSEAEADRREIVNGTPFAEAVAPRPVEETPPFIDGAPIAGIGRVPAFTETAFALGDGEISDLVETEDTVYLLAPFGREESHVPPLAEVRGRVEADFRRARAEAAAREVAERLLARAKEVGLERAAQEVKRPVEEAAAFGRYAGVIPTLGFVPDLTTAAFTLTPEAPLAPRVHGAGGDAVVAALRERQPADMAGFAAAKEELRHQLVGRRRNAAFAAFLSFLKERAQREGELSVRQDALVGS